MNIHNNLVLSKCQDRTLAMICNRICTMDDNRLVAYEYGLSLEISALVRGWVHDNTEGKTIPISWLEESVGQVEIELKLVRAEMLKRGLWKQ